MTYRYPVGKLGCLSFFSVYTLLSLCLFIFHPERFGIGLEGLRWSLGIRYSGWVEQLWLMVFVRYFDAGDCAALIS